MPASPLLPPTARGVTMRSNRRKLSTTLGVPLYHLYMILVLDLPSRYSRSVGTALQISSCMTLHSTCILGSSGVESLPDSRPHNRGLHTSSSTFGGSHIISKFLQRLLSLVSTTALTTPVALNHTRYALISRNNSQFSDAETLMDTIASRHFPIRPLWHSMRCPSH